MPDRDRIPDDFWDIEDLLPAKPARRPSPPPRSTPEAVELELEPRPKLSDTETAGNAETVGAAPLTVTAADGPTHYVSPHKAQEEDPAAPLLEYIPDGVLLHRVKVYGWQANYHYFDQFADDAVRYAAMKPPAEARPETFFSYFPQYTQLGRRTTAWYLYWREGVRRGVYMDTDYAYVLLYLFELINLPAQSPAEARDCRDLMAKTWMAYRRSYPQLDHYMCEWLCDYCLIHELTAPIDLLSPALDDIIMGSRLKEFYLSAAVRIPGEGSTGSDTAMETARILMRHCCQYDYRKSKFAAGEHKELFDRTIPAAIASVLPLLLGAEGKDSSVKSSATPAVTPAVTMLDSTLTRDAYTGALCSYRNKRRIEVAYTSFSRSHELRFLIGDMVKHVENRLRTWIGVRSKLSVMSLPIPLRDALDEYLSPLAPPKNTIPVKKKEAARPAYETLYDLPAKAASVEDAAAIEADSWETTRILVEAFEEHDLPATDRETPTPHGEVPHADNEAIPAESSEVTGNRERGEDTEGNGWPTVLLPYREFLKAALTADGTAQKQAAAALRKMPDAVADEINTLTADPDLAGNPIGDIILEDSGTGTYTLIEDYLPDITPLL